MMRNEGKSAIRAYLRLQRHLSDCKGKRGIDLANANKYSMNTSLSNDI